MGYAMMLTPCINCKQMFSCNPNKVPSLRVEGRREPLCRSCFDKWNQIHKVSKGLPPDEPLPGAYEPCPEEEL